MLAFAANSILCRMALADGRIDAASFTSLRLAAGSLTLFVLVRGKLGGNWVSGAALLIYATAFSFAYVSLGAAIGALLLFGAVQATMILVGLFEGERLSPGQTIGLLLALAGLGYLLSPGISAPPLAGSLLMLSSGVAWGLYSLRGRGKSNPSGMTAGNFVRALPLALVLSVVFRRNLHFEAEGALYAILSGAVASGLGYVVWYAALRGLNATRAAVLQLSVPVLAALGGVLLLGEVISQRLIIATLAILAGIALVIRRRA